MNRVHLEIKRIHIVPQNDKNRALKAFSRFCSACNGEGTHLSPREESFATSKIKLIARLSLFQHPTSITNLPLVSLACEDGGG